MKVKIEGPSNVSIYVYDNNTCVAESFLPEATEINLVTTKDYKKLTDLQTNETFNGIPRSPQRT